MQAKLTFALCMGIFGTIPLFVRLIPLGSAEIALWRAALASFCIFAYFALRGKKLKFSQYRGKLGLLLLSGAVMGINWVTLFESYRHTSVSVATLIYYTAPILVTVASAVFMREKISRFQALCMGMTMLGLVLIVNPAGGGGGSAWLGILLALISAILYATVIMINRFIKDVPGVQRTLPQFGAAVMVLFPYVLLTGGMRIGSIDIKGMLSLLAIGAIQLGATVDYAILITTRYEEELKRTRDRLEAVTVAISESSQSILVSASTMFAATIALAVMSSVGIISSLTMLIARGAAVSFFVVLFVLPAILVVGQPLYERLSIGWPRHTVKGE